MGSPRPRDFQRSRVYSWESTIVHEALRSQLTLGECNALVEKALKRYQPTMATPLIIDARNGKKDWAA